MPSNLNDRLRSENELVTVVLGHCFKIHSKWGPGMLESVYEELLVHYLRQDGLFVEQQKAIPFREGDVKLNVGFRADIIVDKKLLVELKSVEMLAPVVFKTVLTYLRILDLRLGLVVNFGEASLSKGIKRVAN